MSCFEPKVLGWKENYQVELVQVKIECAIKFYLKLIKYYEEYI